MQQLLLLDGAGSVMRLAAPAGRGLCLDAAQHLRGAAQQRLQEGVDVLAGGSVRDHRIGQAPLQRLLRIDKLATAHHAHGPRRADDPAQVRAAAPGRGDGQPRLDEADARARRLQPHVAGQCQLGAATDGIAVQVGQHRQRAVAHRIQGAARLLAHCQRRLPVAHAGQVDQIPACRKEALAGAGQHDAAHPGLRRRGAHHLRQLRQHVAGQRIVFLRPVDRDP
ncbi:hypothetical protein D9M72_291270 [compost metagenome]